VLQHRRRRSEKEKRTGRRMQAELNFSLPRPVDLFKPGTQDYRLYERLLAAPITNAQIIDELRIFSYTRRLSDLREKGINVKATRVRESLFKYEIGRN
jgi:1,2-phenylacetyl-CoA epoxidase catalytic subunit